MIALCTLYDSHYLNRGLALYESIERYTRDYVMYVLAMDDTCYHILKEMNLPRIIPVCLSEIETEELLQAKSNRSVGEFCWTCKAPLIKYTLDHSQHAYCAYLDSDLYFYGDPHLLTKEMEVAKASIMLVGHRFNYFVASKNIYQIGKYCAGTLVFKNDANAHLVLDVWEKQCLKYCGCLNDGIHYGDQKYLDRWGESYKFVKETENLGAGVASWNMAQYQLIEENEFGPTVLKRREEKYNTLFYHFHALSYTSERSVRTFAMIAWGASKRLLDSFYIPYLRHIDTINQRLNTKYDLNMNNTKLIKSQAKLKPKDSFWHRLSHKVNLLFSTQGIKFLLFEDLPTKYYWKQDVVFF